MNIKYRVVAGACIVLGFVPGSALAYGRATHAYLTAEIFDFYNQNFPSHKFEEGWKLYLMNGSRHEDEELRWMNHFYDPVYDRGLTYDPKIDPAFTVIKSMTWKSSKEWARDKNAQEALRYKIVPALASLTHSEEKSDERAEELAGITLGTLEKDFTWQRAVRFYVRGEKEKAMFILGHTLHLIEDASVPDHTRNDPHPDSPYEHWTLKFNSSSPDLNLKKRLENKAPTTFDDLGQHFDSMAKFSNNNFYSKDTIGIQSGYEQPSPDEFEKSGKLLSAVKNLGGQKIILNKQPVASRLLFQNKAEIIFDDPGVFTSYWNLLSTQAVQHGAGVVNLFFEEAERAAKNPSFDTAEPKTRLGQAIDTAASAVVKVGDSLASFGSRISLWGNVLTGTTSGTDSASHEHIDETVATSTPSALAAAPVATSTKKTVVRTASSTPPVAKKVGTKKSPKSVPRIIVPPIEDSTSTAPSSPAQGSVQQPVSGPDVQRQTTSLGTGSGGGGGVAQISVPPEIIEAPTSTDSSPSPLPTAAQVLISEVLYDPEGDDGGEEFVELYNPGSTAVSLDKWTLRYSIAGSTSTPSLASFGGRDEDRVSIPAKSFFLIGLNNYSHDAWHINADLVRASSLPNGGSAAEPEQVTVFLENKDEVRIDAISYNSLSTIAGQSLERKAWSAGVCVEARGAYEGGGNGCDTGTSADFLPRNTPQPQNTESLTEPRTPPEIRNLAARYVPEKLEIDFSWENQTGMSYAVEQFETGTSTLVWEGVGSSANMRIWEAGREYRFRWSVIDAGGLASTRELTFDVPSLVEAYFYARPQGQSTSTIVELRYGSAPFIPRRWSGSEMLWQGVAAYFDRDPNPSNNNFPSIGAPIPADVSGMLQIGLAGNYPAVFGLLPERCTSFGPDTLSRYCTLLPVEDLEVELAVQNVPAELMPDDYITLAFYDYDRDSNTLHLVATDRTKINFHVTPPPSRAPTPPEVTVGFDRLEGVVHISWANSTDPDSPDTSLEYEWQISSSTDLSANNWVSAGPVACCGIGTTARYNIIPSESYLVAVRAKDLDGNVSAPRTVTWTIPDNYFPYVSSNPYRNAYQDFQIASSGAVSAMQVFSSRANLPGPNENTFVCSVRLEEIVAGGASVLVAESDTPHPGDGSSGSYQIRGYECGSQPTFTFASHPMLEPGKMYRWSFSITPNGSVRFYGRGDDVAGGAFSGPELKNAIFVAKGPSGILMDTR